MEREGPRFSHSESVHRRRTLAKARRNGTFDINVNLQRRGENQKRLAEIRNLINNHSNELTIQDKAVLRVEEIWLEFALGLRDSNERVSQLQKFLNQLEKNNPDIYQWLTTEENGPSPLSIIRDRVFPPRRVGSYFTKRN